MDGPSKPDILIHPAHGFWKWDREDEARQDLFEPSGGVAAFFIDPGDKVLALVRGLDGQRVYGMPFFSAKTMAALVGFPSASKATFSGGP